MNELSGELAAALFAVDPAGLGGVVVRCGAGPLRDAWLASLGALLPADAPRRRVPAHVDAERLLGGLDLAATLQAGRPVALRGLLAQAHGGIVTLAMAERIGASTAAAITAAMDAGEVVVERDGIGARSASRFGVVALDEGISDDEQIPARLSERLAFHVRLEGRIGACFDGHPNPPAEALFSRDDIDRARLRFASTRIGDDIVEGLCAASLALGVDSPRATLFACRAARAAAALDGRDDANADDASLAAALVLAPRATQVPAGPPQSAEDEQESPIDPQDPAADSTSTEDSPPNDDAPNDDAGPPSPEPGLVDDMVLEAALAAIPPGLLASLALGRSKSQRNASAGRVGAAQLAKQRGRPMGARRAGLNGGARLNVMETLRTAAPWQAIRRREPTIERAANAHEPAGRILVRQEDFRVWRFRQRSETTTIFVVDASGSAALHRLAETKGAVELLLADCYVRRDSVAVIAFRGARAELLLSPTRSLVRAKRSLAGLPGGGGTPLASGIASAVTLVDAVRRRGATPVVVLLTDGRANIASDGTPGRGRATDDALAAARQLRLQGVAALLLDTSPQAQEPARTLAAEMGARYLPLPYAGAAAMSQAVRAVGAEKPSAR